MSAADRSLLRAEEKRGDQDGVGLPSVERLPPPATSQFVCDGGILVDDQLGEQLAG
jgi:hypothetical protein